MVYILVFLCICGCANNAQVTSGVCMHHDATGIAYGQDGKLVPRTSGVCFGLYATSNVLLVACGNVGVPLVFWVCHFILVH
jgi:hypothetical protein